MQWTVNLTTVIAILSALGSGAYFVAQAKTGLLEAQKDNVRLEAQITGMRSDLKEGIAELRGQINGIPDMRAALANLQQQLVEQSQWRASIETRVANDHDMTLSNRSDLDAIARTSGVSLRSPRSPR